MLKDILKLFMVQTRPLLTKTPLTPQEAAASSVKSSARDFTEMTVGELKSLVDSAVTLHKSCIANQSNFLN